MIRRYYGLELNHHLLFLVSWLLRFRFEVAPFINTESRTLTLESSLNELLPINDCSKYTNVTMISDKVMKEEVILFFVLIRLIQISSTYFPKWKGLNCGKQSVVIKFAKVGPERGTHCYTNSLLKVLFPKTY